MRQIIILISSLAFVGLGMTACSKEGSKKQGLKERSRNIGSPNGSKFKTIPTGEQTPADPNAPVDTQTGNDDDADPVEKPKADQIVIERINRNGINVLCSVQCHSVLMSLRNDVQKLIELDAELYNQTDKELALDATKEGLVTTATHTNKPELKKLKLRIVQIMKDDAQLDFSTDELKRYKDSALLISTNDDLDGAQDQIAALNLVGDEQLLVVTNIDTLQQSDNLKEAITGDLINKLPKDGQQHNIAVTDITKATEAIQAELDFIHAFLAPLSFRVKVAGVTKDAYSPVVKLDGAEVGKDDYKHEVLVDDFVSVTILSTDLIQKADYEVVIEITEI